jgi:CBS domain containing-hemolysin-like protein
VSTLITLVLIAASSVLSAAETAVMLLPAGRVHRLVEAQAKGATALDHLVEHRHRLRAVASLVAGVTFAAAGLTGWAAAVTFFFDLAATAAEAITYAVAVASLLLGVLVAHSLAQALPRTLAAANPERIALEAAPIVLPIVRTLHPVTRFLGAPWRWVARLMSEESPMTAWAVTPEWRGDGDGEENEREEAEEALLEAVSDFAEKVAREVMVPRTDVASLPDTASASDAISLIHKTGFSRLPVFHESIDDVRGVLYAKDLLVALGRGRAPEQVADIARAPFFVPETKPVEELLFEMRTRTHIAIVADEYGGTAGIVTLEDLLEEIVGDIADEYDREEPLLVDLGHGAYRVDARLPVDDLNELLGTDLDTEADSVGGLFTEIAGRIPELGESMEIEGLRFTVTDRQGTRIRELTVEPAASRAEGDPGA